MKNIPIQDYPRATFKADVDFNGLGVLLRLKGYCLIL